MILVATEPRTQAPRLSQTKPSGGNMWPIFEMCMLVLWMGSLAFYGLDAGFLYRTEALRALVARNMLHSGDYLVPTLYGEPLLTKGPVMYAAIAWFSSWWGDVTTWSARIPAALATVLTGFLVFYHLTRYRDHDAAHEENCDTRELERPGSGRVGLSRRRALLVACMIVCNPLWLDKGTSAEIDMLVVFWVTLALVCFFRAVDATAATQVRAHAPWARNAVSTAIPLSKELIWWSLAFLAVAFGTLTKWHAPVFFYATMVTYLLATGRARRLLSWGHLVGLFLAAAVVLGWASVVIYRVGGYVLWSTLWEQALPRISPVHQHGEQLWLEIPKYPVKMLICGLPWTAFCTLTFWRSWYEQLSPATRALMRTLHCWTWPNLLIFTLLPDHDSRHGMPMLTGWLALGASGCVLGLDVRMPTAVRRLTQLGLSLTLLGFTLLLAGIPLALDRLPSSLLLSALGWWMVAAFVVLAGWWARRRERWSGVLMSLLLLWALVKVAFVDFVVPIRSIRDPIGKAAVLIESIPPHETLYIFQAKDEGIMFYYGGKVLRVRGWAHLPQQEQVYCLATERDLAELLQTPTWRVVWQRPFLDEQGDPMVLVLVRRS
ncbi:MAG: hypothetical protein RMI91_13120 [Gemmatales bacterium]|nr:hypothetical protein [Gemmatales bacterium]MDW7995585.1 hypothetical protein [Gemmatales bacterium]